MIVLHHLRFVVIMASSRNSIHNKQNSEKLLPQHTNTPTLSKDGKDRHFEPDSTSSKIKEDEKKEKAITADEWWKNKENQLNASRLLKLTMFVAFFYCGQPRRLFSIQITCLKHNCQNDAIIGWKVVHN